VFGRVKLEALLAYRLQETNPGQRGEKHIITIKVTGHPFGHFAENRYCALNISPIFITFSPNVRQCMQNMVKL
jgi:hypothetical protein